jgi:hypothetical protein
MSNQQPQHSKPNDDQKHLDIVFLLDITGSMTKEIEGMKLMISKFCSAPMATQKGIRITVTTFTEDRNGCYITTKSPYINYKHPQELVEYVSRIKLCVPPDQPHISASGGDGPENSVAALCSLLEVFDRKSNVIVFLIVDSTPHHYSNFLSVETMEEINWLQERGYIREDTTVQVPIGGSSGHGRSTPYKKNRHKKSRIEPTAEPDSTTKAATTTTSNAPSSTGTNSLTTPTQQTPPEKTSEQRVDIYKILQNLILPNLNATIVPICLTSESQKNTWFQQCAIVSKGLVLCPGSSNQRDPECLSKALLSLARAFQSLTATGQVSVEQSNHLKRDIENAQFQILDTLSGLDANGKTLEVLTQDGNLPKQGGGSNIRLLNYIQVEKMGVPLALLLETVNDKFLRVEYERWRDGGAV